MSYLVDGNNVMGQRAGWQRDKPGAQRRLLDELARFAEARRVKVAVVFDGAPLPHFADGASYRGVRVHYALRGSNADERIKGLVEGSRERRTLLVVTSDRALSAYVRSCGAQVVSAGDFRRRLDETARDAGQAPEPEHADPVTEQNMDRWMRYFGVGPDDEP